MRGAVVPRLPGAQPEPPTVDSGVLAEVVHGAHELVAVLLAEVRRVGVERGPVQAGAPPVHVAPPSAEAEAPHVGGGQQSAEPGVLGRADAAAESVRR